MRKLKLEELGRMDAEAFREAPKIPLVVIADNIRSMHNVGSFFRTSDAFRVEKLMLCGYTPRPPHREITKTAIGAENSVVWEYAEEILEVIERLKGDGYKIAVLEQTDASISLEKFHADGEKWAVVLGNEVEGVQQKVVDICDIALEIPQFGTKHSLNVSVAAGITIHAMAMQLKSSIL